jgi:hypothetical protein
MQSGQRAILGFHVRLVGESVELVGPAVVERDGQALHARGPERSGRTGPDRWIAGERAAEAGGELLEVGSERLWCRPCRRSWPDQRG